MYPLVPFNGALLLYPILMCIYEPGTEPLPESCFSRGLLSLNGALPSIVTELVPGPFLRTYLSNFVNYIAIKYTQKRIQGFV